MRNGDLFQGKTILVVDDEKLIRELLRFELEDCGARVIEVPNGLEAYQKLHSEKVDLVVSDVKMPGGSGIELLEKIGQDLHPPPVIMISGFTDLSEQKAQEMGAVHLLHKPFENDELIDLIKDNLA